MAAMLEQASCARCGAGIDADARFCSRCGGRAGPLGKGSRGPGMVAAMVAPPLACLIGSLQPWVLPAASARVGPPWTGPWSLLLLGWPGPVMVGLLGAAVAWAAIQAAVPGLNVPFARVAWRVLGAVCLGAGLAALTLAASPMVGRLSTGLFGLGAWFGLAAGGRLFLCGAAAWVLVSELRAQQRPMAARARRR